MAENCCSPRKARALDSIDPDELAALCKALGHPVRVQILLHLEKIGECYFGSLSDLLPYAASTVSQHVAVLKDAGLICASAEEQRVCYCVNPERVAVFKQLVGLL